jgi:hypothetical protein
MNDWNSLFSIQLSLSDLLLSNLIFLIWINDLFLLLLDLGICNSFVNFLKLLLELLEDRSEILDWAILILLNKFFDLI